MPFGFTFDNSVICLEDEVLTTSAINGTVVYRTFSLPPTIQNSLEVQFFDQTVSLIDNPQSSILILDEVLGGLRLDILDVVLRDDQSNIVTSGPFLEADISFRVTFPSPNNKIPEGIYDIPLVFRVENDEEFEEFRLPIKVKVVYKTIEYWISILNGLC